MTGFVMELRLVQECDYCGAILEHNKLFDDALRSGYTADEAAAMFCLCAYCGALAQEPIFLEPERVPAGSSSVPFDWI